MHRFVNAVLAASFGLLFSLPAWAVTLGQGNDYLQTGGPAYEVPNAGTTGTTINSLAKINGSGNAVLIATTDTSGIAGVVVNYNPTTALGGSATTGNAVIQWSGVAPLTLDNTPTTGDYVIPSTTSAGQGHDTGSGTTCPSAGLIGKVVATASAPVYWVALGTFQCSGSSSAITSLTGDVVTTGSGAATATVIGGPGIFCTGADGALNSGFGTITLTRDMCYSSVTFNSTDQIITAGWRIFVAGTLNIASAQTSAIEVQSFSARTASGSTSPAPISTSTAAQCNAGGNGGIGTTTVGGNGGKGNGYFFSYGGASPAGAVGGAGASAAGTAAAANTPVTGYEQSPFPNYSFAIQGSAVFSGTNGTGGSAGGGDGTHAGGNGGAGGGCGGTIVIAAKVIARGTNANAGIIDARGGPGAAGGNAAASGTNSGGGAGGNGGGGGHVYIVFESLTGSTLTSAIDVSSGAGGAGGTLLGSGANGTGGTSGLPGGIEEINLGTNTYTTTAPATSGANVGSGTTGGASVVVQGSL